MEGKSKRAARLAGVVQASLDEPRTTDELARQAYQSRTQFHRVFRALIEETPAAFRRRLLMERAAYLLAMTSASVTDIALESNYGSLEAFSRAFTRAFRTSPSMYRRMKTAYFQLPSANGIHFHAPGSPSKGVLEMDLFERFAGNDSWHTQRLLEHAATLKPEQLDKPLSAVTEILPWRETTKTLRQILENIIFTKEVWTSAITGRELVSLNGSPPEQRTPAAMMGRLKKADAELHKILGSVSARGAWDDTFVDALCEPPEEFTFGGVFAHIITFNAHRRIMAIDALRQLGVNVKGLGDPIEYERSVGVTQEHPSLK